MKDGICSAHLHASENEVRDLGGDTRLAPIGTPDINLVSVATATFRHSVTDFRVSVNGKYFG